MSTRAEAKAARDAGVVPGGVDFYDAHKYEEDIGTGGLAFFVDLYGFHFHSRMREQGLHLSTYDLITQSTKINKNRPDTYC